MAMLDEQIAMLDRTAPVALRGRVHEVRGLAVHVADFPAPVGAGVCITTGSGHAPLRGEVVGFQSQFTVVMPYGAADGVRMGDRVHADQFTQDVRVGRSLLGRVLNGLGQPIDGRGPLRDTTLRSLHPAPVDPFDRPLITDPLATGVRAVDAMTPIGRGQRMGIFAQAGLGKSVLLGMMARGTDADVSVIALVGERGREVRQFIDTQLGPEGLARSVVVCATGDDPVLLRIRAALAATTIAEYFRDQGKSVLLMMDSVTRFCRAQRQVGLAAGEPPATKGFPPSVFAYLPRLLERSGATSRGSITGLYTVLVDADEVTDPIADAARGVLDGHLVLNKELAEQNHWPAIDVLASISRLAEEITTQDHQSARGRVVQLISAYRKVEDLLNIGAYAAGSNPDFDLAIACKPAIDQLLRQGRTEMSNAGDFQRTSKQLQALIHHIDAAKQQLAKPRRSAPSGPAA